MTGGVVKKYSDDTPWEFLQLEDDPLPTDPPAELGAMHMHGVGPQWRDIRPAHPEPPTRYFPDELPDDTGARRARADAELTAPVDQLLRRQHYIADD